MKFRSDINGLRAYAVIAVVIFHFFPSVLSGGFAGVDVFFVISGYLMTAIIVNRIETSGFSLIEFYLSRANRIIPPLAVLCTALFFWGYFFLPVYDFRIVGRDLFGAITFSSNIIFSLKQDYFEGDTNFLLHTWSLSAEWQFYIVYPILILVTTRFAGIRRTSYFVLLLFFVSFITSMMYSSKYPSESYYLLHTRAWEMVAGGLAFLFPISLSKKGAKATELTGLALIVTSYLVFDEHSIWPGYNAIVPVLGTYLVITSSRSSFLTNNQLAQLLGRWSYSIYLWHWPIAVGFSYYFIPQELKGIGLLLSIFLGFISFKFIECLSFKSIKISTNTVIHTAIAMLLVTVGVGTYLTNGLAFKEDLNSNSLVYGGMDDEYKQDEGQHLLNTESDYDYFLIGDSKAGHLVRGILKSGDKVRLSWYSDCMSFPLAYTFSNSFGRNWEKKCKDNHKILNDSDSAIIISQRWNRYNDPNFSFHCNNNDCGFGSDYETDLNTLLTLWIQEFNGGRNIYIVGELPRTAENAIEVCLRSAAIFDLAQQCNVLSKPIDGVLRINEALAEIAKANQNVFFIDPSPAICLEIKCKYGYQNKPIFQPDQSHLTGLGAEVFWTHIKEKISRIESKFSISE